MEEQVIKCEDWMPEGLPEGWKVEIRVRKTGKKDRYYTDPEHGYIFRSIKDIDRYLLTGKLGRHVTKTKPKESSSGTATANLEYDELSDVSQQKELIKPEPDRDRKKEPCVGLEAHGQEVSENTSKRKASTTAHDSKGATKKRVQSRSSAVNSSSRSPKKKESTPFFILDSDQYDETDATDIPNLSEIIDSMRKEKEGHKTVYVSAPDIGSLLGGKTPKQQGHDTNPNFPSAVNQYIPNYTPNMSYVPPSVLPKQEWGPKPLGVPGRPLFGSLLTDPCIDFAFKTLTGTTTTTFGNETSLQDCFSPQQLGSSRMLSHGGPCQS